MPVNSVLPDLDLIDVPLHTYVLDGLKQHLDDVALIDGDTEERWTGRLVLEQSQCLAAALQLRLGVCKNDVILFFLPNCPRHAISIVATLTIGAVVSGCNPVYNTEELLRQIHDAEPAVIFTDASGIAVVREAVKMARKSNLKIIILDKKHGLRTNEFSFDELLKTSTFRLVIPSILTKTDICLMPYSSGTTGPPKGTLITHYNKVAQLQTLYNRAFFLCPVPGDTTIAMLPWFHIFGLMILLPALRDGVTLVTIRKFKPEVFLKHVQQHKVRMLYIVPPIVVVLAKHPIVAKYNLSSVETVFCGAAPLGEQLSKDLCARHTNIKYLIQGWGMTEITGAGTVMVPTPLDKLRYGSCGILVSNSQAMIVDLKTGKGKKELGPNQDGEFWWKGPGNMKGYLKKPEQTAATIDKDGWVHTGDIGHYDEDGYFYIVDRLKELIKVKGFQVAPAELEDYLLKVNDVADAAVIGVPDEKSGELPVAFVVRKQGSAANAKHIMDAINAHVAPYKKLTAIFFVDEIPKSPSGKILHRVLRERLKKKSKM